MMSLHSEDLLGTKYCIATAAIVEFNPKFAVAKSAQIVAVCWNFQITSGSDFRFIR